MNEAKTIDPHEKAGRLTVPELIRYVVAEVARLHDLGFTAVDWRCDIPRETHDVGVSLLVHVVGGVYVPSYAVTGRQEDGTIICGDKRYPPIMRSADDLLRYQLAEARATIGRMDFEFAASAGRCGSHCDKPLDCGSICRLLREHAGPCRCVGDADGGGTCPA